MNDHVVDTNVLLVASAAHPCSPFDDTHVPIEEQRAVFDWLNAFRTDHERQIVLDDRFRILDEYRNKLTDQDYGLQVVHEKMTHGAFRQVQLAWDENGYAIVPTEFGDFDLSDRKFLAAALTDPTVISIVNATDTDWLEIEKELAASGVTVVQLLESWLRRSKEKP